jgi:hypothetical protein
LNLPVDLASIVLMLYGVVLGSIPSPLTLFEVGWVRKVDRSRMDDVTVTTTNGQCSADTANKQRETEAGRNRPRDRAGNTQYTVTRRWRNTISAKHKRKQQPRLRQRTEYRK